MYIRTFAQTSMPIGVGHAAVALYDLATGAGDNSAGRCATGDGTAEVFANYQAAEPAGSDGGAVAFVEDAANRIIEGGKVVADKFFLDGIAKMAEASVHVSRLAMSPMLPGGPEQAAKELVATVWPGARRA